MSERILDVYLNNQLAGKLIQGWRGGLSFTYDRDASMGISLSLPLREESFEGDKVKAFFSGLLPDEHLRQKLARYLGLSEKNPFALLEVVGGECAGALSLYPEGPSPPLHRDDNLEVLSEGQLKEILFLLKNRPLLVGEKNMRLSLAGAQDKLAVKFHDNSIILVKGTTPTTHILKPLIEHIDHSVHNELFCMKLAQSVGVPTPQSSIHFVDSTPFYLVERYDREKTPQGHFARVHQEDFCQALGILPEIKYEREGGPSIVKCQEVISSHCARPAVDQLQLLKRIIFNYLIGNADAHGKNFSLLYGGLNLKLAPAYDLLSTEVYSSLSDKMAMKIGGKYRPNEVQLRHWHRIVPETKGAKDNLEKQLLTLAKSTLEQAEILKDTFQKNHIYSPIIDDICHLVERKSQKIKNYFIK